MIRKVHNDVFGPSKRDGRNYCLKIKCLKIFVLKIYNLDFSQILNFYNNPDIFCTHPYNNNSTLNICE